MIRLPDVRWPADMHERIVWACDVIDAVHRELTGKEATCTSAYRSQTPGGGSSLHPLKRAVDIRTWEFGDPATDKGKAAVRKFARILRERLGKDFDVIVEGPAAEKPAYLTYHNGKPRAPHVHVEWDQKAEPQADGVP